MQTANEIYTCPCGYNRNNVLDHIETCKQSEAYRDFSVLISKWLSDHSQSVTIENMQAIMKHAFNKSSAYDGVAGIFEEEGHEDHSTGESFEEVKEVLRSKEFCTKKIP